jgi:hypothetical protein
MPIVGEARGASAPADPRQHLLIAAGKAVTEDDHRIRRRPRSGQGLTRNRADQSGVTVPSSRRIDAHPRRGTHATEGNYHHARDL